MKKILNGLVSEICCFSLPLINDGLVHNARYFIKRHIRGEIQRHAVLRGIIAVSLLDNKVQRDILPLPESVVCYKSIQFRSESNRSNNCCKEHLKHPVGTPVRTLMVFDEMYRVGKVKYHVLVHQ